MVSTPSRLADPGRGVSAGWGPVAPSGECRAECRLLARLDERGRPVAYTGRDGTIPCPGCVRALAETSGAGLLEAPLRRIHRLTSRESAVGWDEATDYVADAVRGAVSGSRPFRWLSLARHPRAQDILARRITGLVPGATWSRFTPPVERVARLVGGADLALPRAGLEDVVEADVVVAWGVDAGLHAADLQRALEAFRGHLVVVDPRDTDLARRAEHHVAVRPGTDVPLAGAWLCGRDGARAHEWARAWPAGRAAQVIGVPVDVIEAAGSALAAASRPVVVLGGGLAWCGEAADGVSAVLQFVTALGARMVVPTTAPDPTAGLDAPIHGVAPRDVAAVDAVLPDGEEARDAVVVVEGTGIEERPGGSGLLESLRQAYRVIVLADRRGSASEMADLVLPMGAGFGRCDVAGLRGPGEAWGGNHVAPRPLGWPGPWSFWRGVARRVGWPENWFAAEGAEIVEAAAAVLWTSEPRQGPGEGLLPAEPVHRESGESPISAPALAQTYPLQLVVGRAPDWLRGEGLGVVRDLPHTALLHPDEAARRNLGEGDPVSVFNARGSVEARLALSFRCSRGTVAVAESGAWLLAGAREGRGVAGGLVEIAAGGA